jgi:hypothetical protein
MAGGPRPLKVTALATEGAREIVGHGVCVAETRLTTVKIDGRNNIRIAGFATMSAKSHVDCETVTLEAQTVMLNRTRAARTSEGSDDEAATRQTVARVTGFRVEP